MVLRTAMTRRPVAFTGIFSALIALSGCGSEQSYLANHSQSTGCQMLTDLYRVQR